MFYVNIDKTTDKELEFCGFRLTYENATIKLYEDPHGNEYLVSNDPPRYVYVDDLNDADCLKAAYVLNIQD
jgi:hypothetical protein